MYFELHFIALSIQPYTNDLHKLPLFLLFTQIPVEVCDLFAIPDYIEWFDRDKCIDSRFSRWTKTVNTQHQWKFEAVEPSEYFPYGVRVMYRAFASDEVVEVVKSVAPHSTDAGRFVGLKAIRVQVYWYPVYDEASVAAIEKSSPNFPQEAVDGRQRPGRRGIGTVICNLTLIH